MILKLKRGENWLYIDNILDLSVEGAKRDLTGKNEAPEITLVCSRWHKTGVIAQEAIDCSEAAYILNDSGKTIEKLI